MTERDLCIAEAILQNMSEAQKEHLFEVIKNYNAVRGKFAPIMIAGEEVHMLAAVKISFGFSGQVVLGSQHLQA